jgi:predicted transcriptional regulator
MSQLESSISAPGTQEPGPTSAKASSGDRINTNGWTWTPVEYAIMSLPAVSDRDFRVFCALRFFARQDSSCFPTNETLGEACGQMSISTVKRSLRELEHLGLVKRQCTSHTLAGRVYTTRQAIAVEKTIPGVIDGWMIKHSNKARPRWVKSDPAPGSNLTQPLGRGRPSPPAESGPPSGPDLAPYAEPTKETQMTDKPDPPSMLPKIVAIAGPGPVESLSITPKERDPHKPPFNPEEIHSSGSYEPTPEQVRATFDLIWDEWRSPTLCTGYLRYRRLRDPRAWDWAVERLIVQETVPRLATLLLKVAGEWPGPQATSRRDPGPVYPRVEDPGDRSGFLRGLYEELKRKSREETPEQLERVQKIVERLSAGAPLAPASLLKSTR